VDFSVVSRALTIPHEAFCVPSTTLLTLGQVAAGAADKGNPLTDMMIMLLIIGTAFYFLILRPQNRERKKREELLNQLSKGDKVVTAGGIHAVVTDVSDKETVGIEISKGVKITINRGSVSVVAPKAGEKAAEKAPDKPAENPSNGAVKGGKKPAKA
jgi:preprotein translocase subunit YajC